MPRTIVAEMDDDVSKGVAAEGDIVRFASRRNRHRNVQWKLNGKCVDSLRWCTSVEALQAEKHEGRWSE